jgi:hypothetical protein
MSFTPNGTNHLMKGQLVRPVYKVDLSPLLAIAEAQHASRVKTAQPVPPSRPEIEQDNIPMDGDASGQENTPEPQAPPTNAPSEGSVPQGQGNPSASQGAQPPAMIDQQQDGQPSQDPEQEKAQQRHIVLQLRDKVRQLLDNEGLAFDINTSSEAVRVNVKIKPHVQAEDDQQWYPADQVMAPIVEKMFQMGFDVNEPTQAQAHRRQIDPKAKPVEYVFTYSTQKNKQQEQQDGAYTIPRKPQQGTPVQQQRPSSQMGQVPQQKAAESKTLHELLVAEKDDLIGVLKKLLGGN